MINAIDFNVGEEELEYIKAAHKPMVITPNVTKDEIMYDAGKQYMIQWLERQMEIRKNLLKGE